MSYPYLSVCFLSLWVLALGNKLLQARNCSCAKAIALRGRKYFGPLPKSLSVQTNTRTCMVAVAARARPEARELCKGYKVRAAQHVRSMRIMLGFTTT